MQEATVRKWQQPLARPRKKFLPTRY